MLKIGEHNMQSLLIKSTLIGAFALSLSVFSVDWTPQNGVDIGVKSAHAVVGRPATPGSVAGAHRRAVRHGAYYGAPSGAYTYGHRYPAAAGCVTTYRNGVAYRRCGYR
jgi:hypothetical protein